MQNSWTFGNALLPIALAVIGAMLALLGREFFEWRDRGSVRAQVKFLLTMIAVSMGTSRDYPVNTLHGFDRYLERLVERTFSTDGARALKNRQRAAIYAAIMETEQSLAFLSHERDRFMENQDEYREYMIAAASRAFEELMDALDALGDTSGVVYPRDPRGLHNWRPGQAIPRRDDR